MGLNVPLLRSSFELVVEREPDLTLRFYDVLFRDYPQVRPLFSRKSNAEQAVMLRDMLVAVIDHLEDAPWLTEQLGSLGARHVEYGVRPEMYGWVGASLLETLRHVAGEAWTPELETAWSDAYGAIASLMQQGASSE